ncbi:hypothetical protein OEZ86_013401 [Tetradesmus obliquus]|nr:hypothetical protein OEZ86_013401 [Tetradesmus obliquus]
MVTPGLYISGGIAVLNLCKEIYIKYQSVKRYRDDCKKLAHFVHRVEAFLMETEEEADMSGPGWQAAFSALHESLVEVGEVFDDCARFGIVRSLINADEINLRLSSIAQRMTMALQLIPIQKAKVSDGRLQSLQTLQGEIRCAQFAAARAAEEQACQLKRLMDQSRVDADKTQEMLTQVLGLLQADVAMRQAAAAAGPLPAGSSGGAGGGGAGPSCSTSAAAAAAVPMAVEVEGLGSKAAFADQLCAEVEDLKAEMVVAHRDKKVLEEQYLAQIIAAIEAMEVSTLEAAHNSAAAAAPGSAAAAAAEAGSEVPSDLLCPITYQLLEDPVILVDSHQTYERAAIEEWLSRGNSKDPVTGIRLASTTLVPNVLVRKLAREWLEAHPCYRRTVAAAAAAAAAAAPEAAHVSSSSSSNSKGAGVGGGKEGFSAAKAAAAVSGGAVNAAADHDAWTSRPPLDAWLRRAPALQ